MNNEHNIFKSQAESPKKQPFSVPEAYFESFPGRLNERLSREKAEQVPVRKLPGSKGFRIAIAAALIGLAMISIPLVRMFNSPGTGDAYSELALLESAGVLPSDIDLALYLDTGEEAPDQDESYVSEAIEYLAMRNVELDLIFE